MRLTTGRPRCCIIIIIVLYYSTCLYDNIHARCRLLVDADCFGSTHCSSSTAPTPTVLIVCNVQYLIELTYRIIHAVCG